MTPKGHGCAIITAFSCTQQCVKGFSVECVSDIVYVCALFNEMFFLSSASPGFIALSRPHMLNVCIAT